MDFTYEWNIAVKEAEPMAKELKDELLGMGCGVADEKVYLHAHFHVPMDYYAKAEELLGRHNFKFQDKHPETCPFGEKEGFDVFEKRVPIIEARENDTLKELLDYGILMSGGAGKPHVHVSIPDNSRSQAEALLNKNGYFKKG